LHVTRTTEKEQKLMAQMTVKSLRSQTANEALEILNREISSQNTDSSESLFQGPFGVFNVTLDKAPPNDFTESSPRPARPQKPQPAVPWQSPEATPVNEARPDLWTPESSISSSHNHALVSSPNESSNPGIGTLVHFSNYQEDSASYPPSLGNIPSPILPFSPFVPPASHIIPERAPQLLRYFKNQIVSLSFPLKGSKKCPWQNIHLPRAEKVYAELLLHQTASNTGLSLFYSLLAASCLHICSKNDTTLDWDKLGKQYKQISRHHLELSIQQEIALDTRVKYKELLMALLSTVMLEVPSTQIPGMPLAFDANILCIRSPVEIIPIPRIFW
jgi:arginine metabolism regulation protein II